MDTDDTTTTPTPDDTGIDPGDNENPWDTAIEGEVGLDTFDQNDEDIGATSLDGTWWGTFSLTQELAGSNRTPVCEGDADITIDGTGVRHVLIEIGCSGWTPQAPLLQGGPWGDASGFGFATLDPDNLTYFDLDLFVRATGMPPVELQRLRVNVAGDTMTAEFDNITGFLGLREGQLLELNLTRGTRPDTPPIGPDTANPPDTGAP